MAMEHPFDGGVPNRGAEPAEPRHAATVMLLCADGGPSGAGREEMRVLLLRRARSMSFAPGAYVFPGGRVDERDTDLGSPREDSAPAWWAGPHPSLWAARLGVPVPLGRALVCAAVRETFEETGVLLAGSSAAEVVADTRGEDWEADRRSLIDRSLSFAAFLNRRGLVLRSDLLRAWAQWITPRAEPRRYDTRFFAAVLPEGQQTREVDGEADEADLATWMRPADAVQGWRRGELVMLPPTVATCKELAACGSLESVMAAEREIVPIEPELREVDGQLQIIVPDGVDYPL
ncbi:NUDIX hydrolase [Allosalinactinospora lopnorensis]|uniref:NUDIX hydrolase n=1 Tax=Allosalinactinospora lopnorensis TaxID=1352348 RepID=UPI000A489D43|nr:NUDIX domain-containing protein [Allosalinactinospora lopnorensis]